MINFLLNNFTSFILINYKLIHLALKSFMTIRRCYFFYELICLLIYVNCLIFLIKKKYYTDDINNTQTLVIFLPVLQILYYLTSDFFY